MDITSWLTGIPVLFVLWPGPAGAEPSARFEILLEGLQESEARVFLEESLDRGRLSPDLARRVRDVLARRLDETSILEGPLCVHELEAYTWRWQERSRELYEAAAEAAKSAGAP